MSVMSACCCSVIPSRWGNRFLENSALVSMAENLSSKQTARFDQDVLCGGASSGKSHDELLVSSRPGPSDENSPAPVRLRHHDSLHCTGSDTLSFWPHNTSSYIYGCPLPSAAERDLALECASVCRPVFRPLLSEPALTVDIDWDRPALMSAWPNVSRAVWNGWRWQMGINVVPFHTATVNRNSPPPRARRWYTYRGQLNSMTSIELQAEASRTICLSFP